MGDRRAHFQRYRHPAGALTGDGKVGKIEHALGARLLDGGLEGQPCLDQSDDPWIVVLQEGEEVRIGFGKRVGEPPGRLGELLGNLDAQFS